MSRYRPPQPTSSPYITRQGYEQLLIEQKDIWARRKVVTAALSAAAAEGDRSENAEYIYRKKELRELDRRIRYLQKRIPDLTVIDRRADTDSIFFGAQVVLDTDTDEMTVRIVGSDEIDPQKRYISIDSPLARALLKKCVGDDVSIVVESLTRQYSVLDISYPDD